MNPMGLAGLYKLMLIHAKKEIATVLRLCSDPRNYPVMIHCASGMILPSARIQQHLLNVTTGKDRTGLIAALILKVCEVSDEDVIANYHQSTMFLEPVNHLIAKENGEKGLVGFDDTPEHVMKEILAYLNSDECFGCARNYLCSIGFSLFEQAQLAASLVCLFPCLFHPRDANSYRHPRRSKVL